MLESKFNGKRLKEARLFNELTITKLAEILGVSKQMISKYENYDSEPSLESIFTLTRVLGFPREYFYTKDNFTYSTGGTFFRSHLTSTQRSKQPSTYLLKYTVIIRDYLERFINFPNSKKFDLTTRNMDMSELTKEIRNLAGYETEPIHNIIEFAELLGITVANHEETSEKIDAFSDKCMINNNEYDVIVIGNNQSFYRQQFTIAHEIGHLILHEDLDPADLDKEEYKTMEKEANEFASELLMPKETFLPDIEQNSLSLDSLLLLKRKWKVSMAAIIMRSYSLGTISSDQKNSLFRKLSYKGYRKIEPYDSDTKVNKPVAIRQSLELLNDESIRSGYEIRNEIADIYNIYLPVEILSQITNLKRSFFKNNDASEVVLSLKDYVRESKKSQNN